MYTLYTYDISVTIDDGCIRRQHIARPVSIVGNIRAYKL